MPKYFFMLISMSAIFLCCEHTLPPIVNNYQQEIRINQLGYYPGANKKAVVAFETTSTHFHLVDLGEMKSVLSEPLSNQLNWDLAGEKVRIADFSSFNTPGNYSIYIDDLGYSYPFEIKEDLYSETFIGSIRALYYQRASTEIPTEFGGVYSRKFGHADDSILFHPSTGRTGIKSSPGGWYDAGDYGKYVVNGAYPLGQLLQLIEDYPQILGDNVLGIPESGNGINDYLDELKYEMDWLLTMQDDDGGVFFKLTSERFEGMVMPDECSKQRYLFKKGTAPSLDFAACAAKFSRNYKEVNAEYAQKCLSAAITAWKWAVDNPGVNFKNPEGVITGEYGDEDFSQEYYWAAAEMYLTTQEDEYLEYLKSNEIDFSFKPGESWRNHMHYLAAFSIVQQNADEELAEHLKSKILSAADELVSLANRNDYFQPIQDFQWGSNSDVSNTAYIIAQAYRMEAKAEYLEAVRGIADYIFGKNAVGYSFLTGFGSNTPQNIHHRPSAGDAIPEPIPGLLSGGPNAARQDAHEVTYPENNYPMKSWVDEEPSFASNEICLNWNAPLTYVLGFLEQESSK